MNPKFVQTATISLYSGMGSTDTTCIVNPYPVDLDGNKLVIADFGGAPAFTVDPKISSFEEIIGFSGITDNGNNTAVLTGLTRNLLGKAPYTASPAGGKTHGSSAVVVFSDNPQMYANIVTYINGIAIAGAPNASTIIQGLVQVPTAAQINAGTATGSTGAPLTITPDSLALSSYGTNLNILNSLAGTPFATARRTAPSGFFMYDGSAVSRAANPLTFAAICPSQTYAATSASPTVITANGHGLNIGDRVSFSVSTGGLGITVGLDYYVLSAGFTSNAFQIGLSPSGTAVNTTGVITGTLYKSAFGCGDGSTTFNLPNLCGKNIMGQGSVADTITLKFEVGAVGTNTIAVPDGTFPLQGQKVTLTGTLPTGLATATPYYVSRLSSTSISLASTQALANSAAPDLTFTTTGMSGVCAIVFTLSTRPNLGRTFGEETHGLARTEMNAHVHQYGAGGSGSTAGGGGSSISGINTSSVGGDVQHNIISPQVIMNFMGLAI